MNGRQRYSLSQLMWGRNGVSASEKIQRSAIITIHTVQKWWIFIYTVLFLHWMWVCCVWAWSFFCTNWLKVWDPQLEMVQIIALGSQFNQLTGYIYRQRECVCVWENVSRYKMEITRWFLFCCGRDLVVLSTKLDLRQLARETQNKQNLYLSEIRKL